MFEECGAILIQFRMYGDLQITVLITASYETLTLKDVSPITIYTYSSIEFTGLSKPGSEQTTYEQK